MKVIQNKYTGEYIIMFFYPSKFFFPNTITKKTSFFNIYIVVHNIPEKDAF